MNYKVVINVIGRIIVTEAALLLLPTAISVYYSEFAVVQAFLITAAIAAILGGIFILTTRKTDRSLYPSKGNYCKALACIKGPIGLAGCKNKNSA